MPYPRSQQEQNYEGYRTGASKEAKCKHCGVGLGFAAEHGQLFFCSTKHVELWRRKMNSAGKNPTGNRE